MCTSMKTQPIDSYVEVERHNLGKPMLKSRIKRLFDRQFLSALKPVEKSISVEPQHGEFESSSVCLDKMVQIFIEDGNEKPSTAKNCRNCCNCFSGLEEFKDDESAAIDLTKILKDLIPCAGVGGRNLLGETAKMIERNRIVKGKEDLRRVVTQGLSLLGYEASVCGSRWDKSPSYPSGTTLVLFSVSYVDKCIEAIRVCTRTGEYEYIEVILESERLMIDIDFRSEFEIARPTSSYKSILQTLPYIFVGRSEQLNQILSVVSDATNQSLKKRGMHVPPWRRIEYMRAKWLSPAVRINKPNDAVLYGNGVESEPSDEMFRWELPDIIPKSRERGPKLVTGLASLFKDKL